MRLFVVDGLTHMNRLELDLTQHILLIVQASDPGDRSLASILEEAVVAAYDLLEVCNGERGWDPLTHHRSAIESHAQDDLREPLDAVTDGLREYGIKTLSV